MGYFQIHKVRAVFVSLLMLFGLSGVGHAAEFIARDHLVIDLKFGTEWLRCSVGQNWTGETCEGKIVYLNHEEIKQAIAQANEQLGGNWRLPTRDELFGLVCETCQGATIDRKFFPNTAHEPYWTGEVNQFATRHICQ